MVLVTRRGAALVDAIVVWCANVKKVKSRKSSQSSLPLGTSHPYPGKSVLTLEMEVALLRAAAQDEANLRALTATDPSLLGGNPQDPQQLSQTAVSAFTPPR